jgi:hypothetical protein
LHTYGETFFYTNYDVPGLQSQEYGRIDPSRLLRGIVYPQKLALTSPTSGDRSIYIVRSHNQATECDALPRKHHKEILALQVNITPFQFSAVHENMKQCSKRLDKLLKIHHDTRSLFRIAVNLFVSLVHFTLSVSEYLFYAWLSQCNNSFKVL